MCAGFLRKPLRRRARCEVSDREANPNGSLEAIAGICNRERNVLGLMPHPERAVESPLGSADGLVIFRSMVESFTGASGKLDQQETQKIHSAVRA